MSFEYYTQLEPLLLKEYGRNVQMLVKYITNLESKEDRNHYSQILLQLLKQLNPMVRESTDNIQRIWDHLYLMSDLKLDIDSPYPVPEADVLIKKPATVNYSQRELRFKHYGKNVELLVEKAVLMTDPEERQQAIVYIGKLMKVFYLTWNRDRVEEETLVNDLKILSKGQIVLDAEYVRANKLFDSAYEVDPKKNALQNTDNKTSQNKRHFQNKNRFNKKKNK